MALVNPPKPAPKSLRLHEAADRIIGLEPSLDLNEVRRRLCELIASGDLQAKSEIEDPGNDLAWSNGWKRAGLLGCTFTETWSLWLEKAVQLEWATGAIFIPIAGRIVRIPLPRVEWADVLRLFEVVAVRTTDLVASAPTFTAPVLSIDSPSVQESIGEGSEPEAAPTVPAQEVPTKKVATDKLETWYKGRVKIWPRGTNPPSQDDDWNAAKAQFPEFRVARDQIRGVRSKLAPPDWTKRGRRVDWLQPDKLAKKLAIKPAKE